MSTVKTVKYQVGTDGTSTNNFTIYQPDPPDGSIRVGQGNAGAATDVAKVDSNGFKFTSSIQIGTDATSTNNFTIYQPSTPDGTLRIGVGNADSPTEVAKITANGLRQTGFYGFKYYMSASQSISNVTTTKVNFNTSQFSTVGSDFNISTYRFTPTVAGYYICTVKLHYESITNTALCYPVLYKNGVAYSHGAFHANSGTTSVITTLTAMVDANGTSDYFEMYTYQNTGASKTITAANSLSTWEIALIAQA